MGMGGQGTIRHQQSIRPDLPSCLLAQSLGQSAIKKMQQIKMRKENATSDGWYLVVFLCVVLFFSFVRFIYSVHSLCRLAALRWLQLLLFLFLVFYFIFLFYRARYFGVVCVSPSFIASLYLCTVVLTQTSEVRIIVHGFDLFLGPQTFGHTDVLQYDILAYSHI